MKCVVNFETTGRSKVEFKDREDLRKKVLELAQRKTRGGRVDFHLLSVEISDFEICVQTRKFLLFAAQDAWNVNAPLTCATIADAIKLFRKMTTGEYQCFCVKGDLDSQVMDIEIDLAILAAGGELRTIKELL